MTDLKWRFPHSGHGKQSGLSSGDAETFKKAPYTSFAREILQNSIDARVSDEMPVKVELNEFDVDRSDIPGIDELVAQVERCQKFWAHKDDYKKRYDEILKCLRGTRIHCLRVSDYNTTGLIGVDSAAQEGNKFLALAKGSGVSEKSGNNAGGSKGIGKNAAFLMSKANTVFYSTYANEDINENPGPFYGYMGVAELVSGYVDDEHTGPDDDYTQGGGYFCSDDKNNPIASILDLDSVGQIRQKNSGTDIFIIGFANESGWEKEVINSLLDSFMVSIYRNHLEISINGKQIDSNTLEALVYDNNLIYKSMRSGIVSQYMILSDKEGRVKTFDIETDYGHCDLYVLGMTKEEEGLATHKCAMIRHPLMKIRDQDIGKTFRASAMCIIPEGTLGEALRNIENPQHNNWQLDRIPDLSVRKEFRNILGSIYDQINECVAKALGSDTDTPIDPTGAGEYLPESNEGEYKTNGGDDVKPSEVVNVTPPKSNVVPERNANTPDETGNGLEPVIGSQAGDGDDLVYPSGHNGGDGGEVRPGSETSGKGPGDDVVLQKKKLSGVHYKFMVADKENGKVRIAFVAPSDQEKCYLAISMLDDVNNRTPVEISALRANGNEISCDDKIEYGPFEIKRGQKMILDAEIGVKGYFGSEVKVICK